MTFKIEENTIQGLKGAINAAATSGSDGDLLPLLDEWDKSYRPLEDQTCIKLVDEDGGPATEASFRGHDSLAAALQERGRIRYGDENAYGELSSYRCEGV